jgi:hypothetical protein
MLSGIFGQAYVLRRKRPAPVEPRRPSRLVTTPGPEFVRTPDGHVAAARQQHACVGEQFDVDAEAAACARQIQREGTHPHARPTLLS